MENVSIDFFKKSAPVKRVFKKSGVPSAKVQGSYKGTLYLMVKGTTMDLLGLEAGMMFVTGIGSDGNLYLKVQSDGDRTLRFFNNQGFIGMTDALRRMGYERKQKLYLSWVGDGLLKVTTEVPVQANN